MAQMANSLASLAITAPVVQPDSALNSVGVRVKLIMPHALTQILVILFARKTNPRMAQMANSLASLAITAPVVQPDSALNSVGARAKLIMPHALTQIRAMLSI